MASNRVRNEAESVEQVKFFKERGYPKYKLITSILIFFNYKLLVSYMGITDTSPYPK